MKDSVVFNLNRIATFRFVSALGEPGYSIQPGNVGSPPSQASLRLVLGFLFVWVRSVDARDL